VALDYLRRVGIAWVGAPDAGRGPGASTS